MDALSFTNPRVQRLRRLAGRRSARHDEGVFVIEGAGLIAEAVNAGWSFEAQFVAVGAVEEHRVEGAGPVVVLGDGVLERVATTEAPQPVIAIARMRRPNIGEIGPMSFAVVAAGLADPGNLGTVLRSAEAAGAEAVLCGPGTVDWYSPKVVRASAGALFHVPVVGLADPTDLRGLGMEVIGTSSHDGGDYDAVDLTRPLAMVLGNEAHGVGESYPLDARVRIPHIGRSESLNVAMAAAVLCFEVARQRRHTTQTP